MGRRRDFAGTARPPWRMGCRGGGRHNRIQRLHKTTSEAMVGRAPACHPAAAEPPLHSSGPPPRQWHCRKGAVQRVRIRDYPHREESKEGPGRPGLSAHPGGLEGPRHWGLPRPCSLPRRARRARWIGVLDEAPITPASSNLASVRLPAAATQPEGPSLALRRRRLLAPCPTGRRYADSSHDAGNIVVDPQILWAPLFGHSTTASAALPVKTNARVENTGTSFSSCTTSNYRRCRRSIVEISPNHDDRRNITDALGDDSIIAECVE